MYSGVTAILSRISWWLWGPKRKYCKSCCLNCQFYKDCRRDVEAFEEAYKEAWE